MYPQQLRDPLPIVGPVFAVVALAVFVAQDVDAWSDPRSTRRA